MKILFTRFPLESADGGAERQTLCLMQGLRERGHDVHFLGSCPVLLKQATACGIPAHPLIIGPPPVTKWHALSFLWRKNGMRRALSGAIHQLNPDAIFMLSLSEKILSSQSSARLFWIEHDRIGPWLTHNPWLRTLKDASKKATIICVSKLSAQRYVSLGFDATRLRTIENGIDLHRFDHSLSSTSSETKNDDLRTHDHDTLRIGCVSRLSEEKGVDVLIHAVADLPNVTLTIVGTGPQEGFLTRLIDELRQRFIGVPPSIFLRSSLADLGAFYRSLDIFVLPSTDHDPFGLVAAEAMSMGIATIVTDQCGISDSLMHKHHALIVPAGDIDALRTAVLQLRSHALRRMLGLQGRLFAAHVFSAQRMIDRYNTLLT